MAASTTASTCWQRPGALPGSLPKMRSSSSACCPWRHSMASICRPAGCGLHISADLVATILRRVRTHCHDWQPAHAAAANVEDLVACPLFQAAQAAARIQQWDI